MRPLSLCVVIGLFALVFLGPRQLEAPPLEVRCIDGEGRDTLCPSSFAWVRTPDRARPTLWAPLEDFAYAAAEAGPLGSGLVLAGLALLAMLLGLWERGILGGIRRLVITLALGLPFCVALLYTSCFLDGRCIVLGPEAVGQAPASLHTQTHHTTGLLGPADLAQWHLSRGFRVLNVSDKDSSASAAEARRFVRQLRRKPVPPMLVLRGEEWHGHPDLVLVNVTRDWNPSGETVEQTVTGVRDEGGASFLAHPWSKVPGSVEQLLSLPIDGVEVVNGVIHGGRTTIEAARRTGKAMLGVIDYKFGPHVNALTLIPEELARTPAGVVEALRERLTRVLYAVPGGAVTGASWHASRPGPIESLLGLRVLYEVPRLRRGIWLAYVASVLVIWRLAVRERRRAERRSADGARRGRRLGRRGARLLFGLCALGQFLLPVGLSWQVREWLGPIPVPLLLAAAALLAIPLLAASQVLAHSGRESA